jgi:dephospho-CoA kinase
MSAVIVGLTGGIASGKSTVGRMLAEMGADVVDADRLARDAVRPGEPAWQAVRATFGERALRPDGTLDRAWLGERVFADAEARRRLNAIIHPVVVQELQQRIAEVRARPPRPDGRPHVLVAEVPLLIEEGLTDLVDRVLLVVVQPATQVARLMHDRGMPEEAAWARVRAQLPVEVKRRHAHRVLDGEADLAVLRRQVEEVWTWLCEGANDVAVA